MKIGKKFLIVLILILVVILAYSFSIFNQKPYVKINDKIIHVEIADEPEEREKGLMFRENLKNDGGMFFVFDYEMNLTFWMKNTIIPLDIIFIDKDMVIIKIHENAQPCKGDPCEIYSSEEHSKYVLEVNGGFSKVNNIQVGDEIDLET